MNNETLVKDLCARNAFGVWLNDEANGYSFKMKGIGESTIEEDNDRIFVFDANSDEFYLTEIKPILFPSITEPITINGETFVPIVRMLEILFPNSYTYRKRKNGRTLGAQNMLGYTLEFENMIFSLKKKGALVELNQLELFDFMNRNHINYRLSPNQFVAVTENFNPYL